MVFRISVPSTQLSNKILTVYQTTIIRDPKMVALTRTKPRKGASSMTENLNPIIMQAGAVLIVLNPRILILLHKITDSKRTITKIIKSLRMIRGLLGELHVRYAGRKGIRRIATAQITKLRNE